MSTDSGPVTAVTPGPPPRDHGQATPGQAADVAAGLEARQRAREASDLMRAAMAASDAHSAVGTDDWPAWEAAAKAAHEILAAAAPAAQQPQPAPGRQAAQHAAALRGLAQIREHVHDDLPDWADVQLVVDDVIAEVNELADAAAPDVPQPAPELAGQLRASEDAGNRLRAALMAAHKEGRTAWASVDHLKAQLAALRLCVEREPAAAPELAAAMAETADVRDGYARLCGEFSDSPQSGQSARISLTVLNRHRVMAGLGPRRPSPAGERRDPYMQATEDRDRYRELLDDIGVMAANAPEDGDSFGLLEQIAMQIAAVDIPDSTSATLDQAHADLREAQHAARTHRERLTQLLGDTPFEFKPDWASEYES